LISFISTTNSLGSGTYTEANWYGGDTGPSVTGGGALNTGGGIGRGGGSIAPGIGIGTGAGIGSQLTAWAGVIVMAGDGHTSTSGYGKQPAAAHPTAVLQGHLRQLSLGVLAQCEQPCALCAFLCASLNSSPRQGSLPSTAIVQRHSFVQQFCSCDVVAGQASGFRPDVHSECAPAVPVPASRADTRAAAIHHLFWVM
jgi:hypothetical protein